ncbi:DUF4266 domain-containing protein [Carboxylicivirga sp. N1Y90]|uniref:DUF4266 domain-containing protein n=1 Tax=Carboxylicivirga fragile TaxID=3417571 RepID=UPI003D34BE08|nr:DUF4266 domain-containing protein [Marinilabiliaceae bacterium N1Y90]
MSRKIIFALGILFLLSSCVAVKGYQKVRLSDPDMALSDKKADRNISNIHAYREGSSGANGGKTGGGCGCN